jgi:hypothetical protein
MLPVFQKRLAASPLKYFTGEFKIGLYRKFDMLYFTFDNGIIIKFDVIKQEYGNVNMPIEMFTQLVSGFFTVDDLYPKFFTEIFVNDEDDLMMLRALFNQTYSFG